MRFASLLIALLAAPVGDVLNTKRYSNGEVIAMQKQ